MALISLKRKRIARERDEALVARLEAGRDLAAAIREAEAALEALKQANDRLYRSDVTREQVALNDLRRARDRAFAFQVAKECFDEAPRLTKLLGVKVVPVQAPPLVEWIAMTGAQDIAAATDPETEAKGA